MKKLPDGTTTTKPRRYAQAWRALATPIEQATGARLYGFDPGLLFVRTNGSTFNVPTDVALAFAAERDAANSRAARLAEALGAAHGRGRGPPGRSRRTSRARRSAASSPRTSPNARAALTADAQALARLDAARRAVCEAAKEERTARDAWEQAIPEHPNFGGSAVHRLVVARNAVVDALRDLDASEKEAAGGHGG